MTIFFYLDYREYLKDLISGLPKSGRGAISKIALQLGVHSTLFSMVLSGQRELTMDQAFDLSQYLRLSEAEADYLSLLVQYNRAGKTTHKSLLRKKILSAQQESRKVSKQFEHDKVLSENDRSIFYSSWQYSAIRLFLDTKSQGYAPEEVAERFQISRPKALSILEFLSKTGLAVQSRGLFKMGPQLTFLEQGSPHLLKHHSNWRVKAIQSTDELSDEEMIFTCPMTLSKQDFLIIRDKLNEFVKELSPRIKASKSEEVACLNIDLFIVKK